MSIRERLVRRGERIMVVPTVIVDCVVRTGYRLGRSILQAFGRGLAFLLA